MAKYKKLRAQHLKALRASRTYGFTVWGDSYTQKPVDITVRVADQDGTSANAEWSLSLFQQPPMISITTTKVDDLSQALVVQPRR